MLTKIVYYFPNRNRFKVFFSRLLSESLKLDNYIFALWKKIVILIKSL